MCECVVKKWPGEVTIVNGRLRNPKYQGLIEQGNHMVEKLLGVRLYEYNGCDDYPPWSEWLSFIQCKYFLTKTFFMLMISVFVVCIQHVYFRSIEHYCSRYCQGHSL